VNARVALHAEVVVVGGGSAGVAAALAAAQCGRDVVLVEDAGFLGGTATIAGVQSYCGFYTSGDAPQQIVAGMGQRVLDRLHRLGHPVTPLAQSSGNWIILLDPERLKRALDELVTEAGVRTLLHCRVIGVERRGGHIQALVCSDPEGVFQVQANAIVDASGNANLAALVAPSQVCPRRQAATLTARISGVDPACALTRAALEPALADYQQRTGTALARANGGYFVRLPWSGDCWAMLVDVDIEDATSQSLSQAEMRARGIAHAYLASLRRCVPGFADARIDVTGPRLGVRSTRCVHSRRDVDRDDVLGARRHVDAIARSGWPCELHPRPGITEYHPIPGEGWFHVPYGALIPREGDTLWLAGSCIGADDVAFGSVRVMGCAFATGHAAGVAAALACTQGPRPAAETVRARLLQQGAIL